MIHYLLQRAATCGNVLQEPCHKHCSWQLGVMLNLLLLLLLLPYRT
jgi:hypothetical protein